MTAVAPVAPARVQAVWLVTGVLALGAAFVLAVAVGAVSLDPGRVALEVLDRVPGVALDSQLSDRESAIVWQLRLPRVVLGILVGGMLAMSGASFQGVFRNPLADPYLLGASSGAGLGATIAIVSRSGSGLTWSVPLAAFVGALAAVGLAYLLASVGVGDRSSTVLLLAGVAVAAFLSAIQTFLQQRHAESIREVYSWLIGSLSTAGWGEVRTVLPYGAVSAVVLLANRRVLDVLSVGDEEATTLGLRVLPSRLLIVAAASLATAAAVSVSGLIGFVGIVVPHTLRMLTGSSYRVILPLSLLFGGAFLTGADLLARTVLAPAEVPIGVITAVLGAPFFAVVLRSRRRLSL
jgi:iron complex transport system permease protein